MSVRNSFLDPVAILHPAGGLISFSTEIDQYLVRLTFSFGSIGTWSTSVVFFFVYYLLGQQTDRQNAGIYRGIFSNLLKSYPCPNY